MGFVKSGMDLNLYYFMVGGEPLILVLYMDDIFLTGSPRLIEDYKRVRDDGFGVDALFSRSGGMVDIWGDLPWSREICYEILKKFRMLGYRPMSTPMIVKFPRLQ